MAVNYVMYTSNPKHDFEFSWTIEHFSDSPDVLRGPSISPIPGFFENVCLELKYYQDNHSSTYYQNLNVSLINLKVNESCHVSGYTSIRNTNGKIIEEDTTSSSKLRERIPLLCYFNCADSINKPQLSQKLHLLEDKLVVKGKLSISGYAISSSVSSLKDESEACGELLKDLKTMYQRGSSSDITFSVGVKTLRAHKTILRSRSPVFEKMFDTDMLESISSQVVIQDSDFHAFNCFLSFLYTGIVEDKTRDTVLSLYSLAHKYQVNSLHSICSGILGKSLTIGSVCSVLALADLHEDKELKNVAQVFFRHHLHQVVETTDWSEIPQLLKEVLVSLVPQAAIKKEKGFL